MCEVWQKGLFVAAMKPYTKTSSRFVYVTATFSLCVGFSFWYAIICSPNRWCHRFTSCNSVLMKSLAVYDNAQKNGGDSHHPICRQVWYHYLDVFNIFTWSSICLCHWPPSFKIHLWCLVLRTWNVYFRYSCPQAQVWRSVVVHTVPAISLLLLVPVLPLLS